MRLILSALALLLAVVFALQNTAVVDVSLFFWHRQASLAIIIALCLVLGLLIGFASLLPLIWRARREARRLQGRLAAMEEERMRASAPPPPSPSTATVDASAASYSLFR
jgi:uncharacterized integral membrane protein